ncbi:putative response regulatory protein [compost metagenome]
MINLMIVDDEERARTGIRTLIDWASHDVEIIAEAGDGAEALELMHKHHVDILLADIRMPEMDGLALIEQVKRDFPHVKSVIMSGYNDFHYVKKAIALGASDYLLKPSRRQEITDTIVNVVGEILEEKRQTAHLKRLTEGFRESLPLLKERTLSQLVLSEEVAYDKIRDSLELNRIYFPNDYFAVFVMQLDNLHTLQKSYTAFELELLKYGLKNISEETVRQPNIGLSFEHQDDIIAILNMPVELDSSELLALAGEFQSNAKNYLKLGVSVGIGVTGTQLPSLNLSYSSAISALDDHYALGPGKIVNAQDSRAAEHGSWSYPILQEKTVLLSVMNGDANSIRESLATFMSALPSSKEQIVSCSLSLYFALYKLYIEKNAGGMDDFGLSLQDSIHNISKEDPEGIKGELLTAAIKVNELLNAKKNKNKLFESILAYIEENYYKDISRETVANEVFITPGYLSLLFKQQIKTNFLDYLHKIRIDQACLLLKDRSRKIGDIAMKVGYNDEKYFFQVFKKYTGFTPNQYRNNLDETGLNL